MDWNLGCCIFNSVDGMWKVEAESSGDVSWRCECVGQTSCRNFLLVLGSLGGGGQAVRSTMKMMCNTRHIKVTAG